VKRYLGIRKTASLLLPQITRTTFTIAITFLCGTAAAEQPLVTIISPCECLDAHGKGRWSVKNDPATPPADATEIQPTTPSQMFNWPAIGVQLDWQSKRTGIENTWYALTGRVFPTGSEMQRLADCFLVHFPNDSTTLSFSEVPLSCQLLPVIGHFLSQLPVSGFGAAFESLHPSMGANAVVTSNPVGCPWRAVAVFNNAAHVLLLLLCVSYNPQPTPEIEGRSASQNTLSEQTR
jgi:hypothetical protein